jgi:hypothetical protein
MPTTLFLRSEAFNLAGTFPTGETDAQTANFTATGANTLRAMYGVKGLAQTSINAATAATVSAQFGFMGFWASPPLDSGQTIGGGAETLTINVADYESNLAANFCINRCHAYVWRPSTGAAVGDLCTTVTAPSGSPTEPTAAASVQVTSFSVALSSVSANAGDIIIVELWAEFTQDAAGSYAANLYYDGSTETTVENTIVSDHAAFAEFSQAITFAAPEARLTQQSLAVFGESSITPEARLTQQSLVVFGESILPAPDVLLTGQSVIVWYVEPPPPIDLECSTTDQVTTAGDLSTSIQMDGQAADQVTATGNIATAISLEGHAEAHAEAHAELTQKKLFKFVINHVGVKGDIDFDTQAARRFYGEVRKFAERTKPWQTAIFYEINPDETWDLTLVSARVYGRRDEYLAVMAAAGIDSVDQPLRQKRLVLPTEAQLYAIKRRTGFESIAELREDYRPVWIN